MEQPMFYAGQAVRCINNKMKSTNTNQPCPLIEGKRYFIESPDYCRTNGHVQVTVYGIYAAFQQTAFIPEEADNNIEEQIFEALKGIPETL